MPIPVRVSALSERIGAEIKALAARLSAAESAADPFDPYPAGYNPAVYDPDGSIRTLDKANEAARAAATLAAQTAYETGPEREIRWNAAELALWTQGVANSWTTLGDVYLMGLGTAATKQIHHQLAVPIEDYEPFHYRTKMVYAHAASGNRQILAHVSFAIPDTITSTVFNNSFGIGVNNSGALTVDRGGSLGAFPYTHDHNWGPQTFTSTQFLVVDFEGTPDWISVTIQTEDGVSGRQYKISRASVRGAGAKLRHLAFSMQDTRGTSGNAVVGGVLTRSHQPGRYKGSAEVSALALYSTHRIIAMTAPDGSRRWIMVPKDYDPATPAPVVLWMHQSITGNERTMWTESRSQPVIKALLDAGYIVAASSDGITTATAGTGDRWGNAASLAENTSLYQYVRDNFSTGRVFLAGASMGFLTVANLLHYRTFPTPAGIVDIAQLWDLDAGEADATFGASVRAAYGGTSATYAVQSNADKGYNPKTDMEPWEYRYVPMAFFTTSADPNSATQIEAFRASIIAANAAPEYTIAVGTGGHLDASAYRADDVLAFMERWRALPDSLTAFDMKGKRVKNVAPPEELSDAATRGYVEARTIAYEPSYLSVGLVANPSFENWLVDGSAPANWNVFWGANSVMSPGEGRTGPRCVRTTFGPNAGDRHFIADGIKIVPGQTIYAEAWVRASSASCTANLILTGGTSPNLQPFSGDIRGDIGSGAIAIGGTPGTWRKISITWTPQHPEMAYVGARLLVAGPSGAWVEVDDFYMMPVISTPDETAALVNAMITPEIGGTLVAKTYYEKYPDGRLVCAGQHSFPASANNGQVYAWTYPIPFVGEVPHVTVTASSTVPQNIFTGITGLTLVEVDIRFLRTTSAATTASFRAEGRWK